MNVNKEEKKDKKDKKEKKELSRSEVNLLKYPFYTLDKNRFKRIKFEEVETKNGKTTLKSLIVSPDLKMGLPTPFDAKIFRIIEMHLYRDQKRNGKIADKLDIGPTYRICKILKIKYHSGNRKLIKDAIKRLSLLGFLTENIFYSNEKKHLGEASFHLFDYKFKGEELKNGEIADSNYIYPSPTYKKNLETYNIKPLDFAYIRSLNSGIAFRLCELLGVKFFKIKDKKNTPIRYSYENLCKILPLKEQKYLSYIKRQLIPALKELKETKFLKDYILEEKGNKIFIKFYPGEKYFEEVKSGDKSKISEIQAILNLKEYFLTANRFKTSKGEPKSFTLKKKADDCYKNYNGDCQVEITNTIRIHPAFCKYCKKLKKGSEE